MKLTQKQATSNKQQATNYRKSEKKLRKQTANTENMHKLRKRTG